MDYSDGSPLKLEKKIKWKYDIYNGMQLLSKIWLKLEI